MPSNDLDIAQIERVHEFERRCKTYQEMRTVLTDRFRKAVETVGETWKDADYRKIVELSETVELQLRAAGRVVDERLVPLLERTRKIIDEKNRR